MIQSLVIQPILKKTISSMQKKEKFQLISKLNPQITQGGRTKEDEFEFNKDAGMYVCKAGHMAIRKARTGKKTKDKIKNIRIILISKNVKYVLSAKVGIMKGQKVKHIQFQSNLLSIRNKKHSKTVKSLRSSHVLAIK